MQNKLKLNSEQAKNVFNTVAMFVHGYASLIANNSFKFDKKQASAQLKQVFNGAAHSAVYSVQWKVVSKGIRFADGLRLYLN